MHPVARAALLALVPSLAAAQTDTRYPARQQGAPVSGATAPARVLVLECPAEGAAIAEAVGDSATRSLVAALCARASRTTAPGTAEERPSPTTALASPLGPPEPAISLLLRLAESTADSASELAEPAAFSESRSGHAGHGDGAGAGPNADEPALPFEPRFRIHLFGDVKYAAVDSTGSRNGFALGQFDLFGHSQLSDHLSVLTEATLTALPRNTYSAKLERLILTYAASDYLAASVGRYHTAIGYYNTAFHHGTWFQTATGRPLIFAIDGDIGLVPIHTLGLSVGGALPAGALGLRYVAELGSGRAGQSSPAAALQPGLSDNNTLAMNLGLTARPSWLDGLQLGASVYRDRVTLQDTSAAPIAETIAAAHAVYRDDALELLGEAVLIRHAPRGLASDDIRGFYTLLSRRIGQFRPYTRFDWVDVPASDALFGFLGRRSGPTVGVRYDFDALAALKVQAGHLNQTTRPTMNRVEAQVSFMF
jgi:hypothetical protein